MQEFNNCPIEDSKRKGEIIQELFGSVGVNPSIEHNFHCDLGYNIHVGDSLYAGYNCTILDMAEVRIGDNCMIGPNVGLYTAGHSVEPKDRNKSGYAIPIKIDMMSGLVVVVLSYLESLLEIIQLLVLVLLLLKMYPLIQ